MRGWGLCLVVVGLGSMVVLSTISPRPGFLIGLMVSITAGTLLGSGITFITLGKKESIK